MTTAATIARRIPGWIGFLALILVGAAMTINGIANRGLDPVNRLGFLDFGLLAVAIGAFSWIAAGNSQIKGQVGKVGVDVEVKDVPWWAWLIDLGLLAIAIVIFVAAR